MTYGKRYGDTKTHLVLSEKAQEVYDGTDNINIFETEDEADDGETVYVYRMTGLFSELCISAEEVNEILESFYDDIHAYDEED